MTLPKTFDAFLEVEFSNPENFSKIRETLSRIGIANERKRELYQSCHILHKQGRYFILHFKELFLLDYKEATLTDEDLQRRNLICKLLVDWGLCELISHDYEDLPVGTVISNTRVLKYDEKDDWVLVSKHTIGRK